MGKNVDVSQLKKFAKDLQKLGQQQMQELSEACLRDLAAAVLASAIKKTPVGDYKKPVVFTTKDGREVSFTPKTGKLGGTLRRGWIAKTEAEAAAKAGDDVTPQEINEEVHELSITKFGDSYQITIYNPVNYASYVEFGHRKPGGAGWVDGKFMMTMALHEVNSQQEKILEKRIKKFLERYFNGQ